MPTPNRPLKVFLCYTHIDKVPVKQLYDHLVEDGVDVWMDKEKLFGGSNWEYEIRKAVRECDIFIVCVSQQFIKQYSLKSFSQTEVGIALDETALKPKDEIYIIPVRLEECKVPKSISPWHWVDLFDSDGYQRLVRSLNRRIEQLAKLGEEQPGHSNISIVISGNVQGNIIVGDNNTAQVNVDTEKSRLEAEDLEKQRLAKELADREAAERLVREKAKKDAAEKARLETEELAKQKAVEEKADRETAEKAAREKAKKEAAEKARLEAEEEEKHRFAKEKAERESRKNAQAPKQNMTLFWVFGVIAVVLLIAIPALNGTFSNSALPSTRTPLPQGYSSNTPTKTPTKGFTPTAYVGSLPTEITDKGVTMRLVPAGDFKMGGEQSSDAAFAHTVYLDDFYMDKYEVTNALYNACVEAGNCIAPKDISSFTRLNYYGNSEFDNYPVIYIDWNQAVAYCEWRGARLPTEAEWEKAACGTEESGDSFCDTSTNLTCYRDTTPVGSHESGKSPYGIYDLAGNVWEWTADWYLDTYYLNSPSSNPLGPDSGQYRVLRGGSWNSGFASVRCTIRRDLTPDRTLNEVGFRCVRSP